MWILVHKLFNLLVTTWATIRTPERNAENAMSAVLLSLHLTYIIARLNPSMPAWITKLKAISLWLHLYATNGDGLF